MADTHDPSQFRKPVGKKGRLLLNDMNQHHRGLTEWALSKIPRTECKRILDIGCGGGMLISLLAQLYPKAVIHGVDISKESVAMTKKVNEGIIKEGRCHVSLGSVSDLPFDKGTFDLVTAFETYFFWPDLDNDIRKAASMVGAGGCIVIVSETYPHADFKERNDDIIRQYGLKLLENDAMASVLESCGLRVTINEVEEKNWVAFVGKR